MIYVEITAPVDVVNDEIFDRLCDAFAGLDPVTDDMLDWSVSVNERLSTIEFAMTIDADDARCAVDRANELMELAIMTSGGTIEVSLSSNTVSAELVDA